MKLIEALSLAVTFTLILGLALFLLGISIFFYEIIKSLGLPIYFVIAFVGLILITFGLILGKIFSKVRW